MTSNDKPNNYEAVVKNKIIEHKTKQYETEISSGCMYGLFAPFLLLFGLITPQPIDVKPPTRQETSSLLVADDSEEEEEEENHTVMEEEDQERVIQDERTILDKDFSQHEEHNEMSLDSYLYQSLEDATSVLNKEEEQAYKKFKDSSYRNIDEAVVHHANSQQETTTTTAFSQVDLSPNHHDQLLDNTTGHFANVAISEPKTTNHGPLDDDHFSNLLSQHYEDDSDDDSLKYK